MKYGRLEFVAEAEPAAGGHKRWLCRCDCGTVRTFDKSNVKRGISKSCGCLRDELAAIRATTHGKQGTGAYRSWQTMRQRCYYEKSIGFANYGGRGISVCERWVDSFENFYADMGDRPPKHTLDRINPDGHYEPGNCRWITSKEQNRNRRDNKTFEYQGKQRTIPEIAEMVGIKESTLRRRLYSHGYTLEDAVSVPVRLGGYSRERARLHAIYAERRAA